MWRDACSCKRRDTDRRVSSKLKLGDSPVPRTTDLANSRETTREAMNIARAEHAAIPLAALDASEPDATTSAAYDSAEFLLPMQRRLLLFIFAGLAISEAETTTSPCRLTCGSGAPVPPRHGRHLQLLVRPRMTLSIPGRENAYTTNPCVLRWHESPWHGCASAR